MTSMSAAEVIPLFDAGGPAPNQRRPVLAADRWNTNADLIVDVARLGWLRPEWLTLDATYGEHGGWWKRWRPDRMATNDLHHPADIRADFRCLPFADSTFDAVAYDPPYMLLGGRTTLRKREDFADRFGLINAPRTIGELEALMVDGLTEIHRCVKPGGYLLTKSATRVSSGDLWSGTYAVEHRARSLGCVLSDRFLFITTPIGDPPGTVQQHARQNYSELLVFRKAKP